MTSTAARALPVLPPLSGEALLGGTSGAVWTRGQALAVLPRGVVDARVRTGAWQVPWPGVHADSGHVLDGVQQAWAAVFACGGADQPLPCGPPDPETGERRRRLVAVAAGRTAARLLELPLIDDDDPATGARDGLNADVAVWRHQPPLRQGDAVLHRRQLVFGAGDIGLLACGLWSTTVLRTLVDCRLLLSLEALVCAMDHALHRALVTPARLEDACVRIEGWAGAPRFRQAVALADGRSESPGETLTRLVLRPVLPGLVPQVRVRDAAGTVVARLDLGDDRLRFAVEFDGRVGHEGSPMVAKDRRRDGRTDDLGWATERATWFDVRRRQDELRTRVLAAADRHHAQR